MKRPSLKSKKQTTPQEMASTSPFDPLPDPKAEKKRQADQAKAAKKQRAGQEKATKKQQAQQAKAKKQQAKTAKQQAKAKKQQAKTAKQQPQAAQGPQSGGSKGKLGKPLRVLGAPFRLLGRIGRKPRIAILGVLGVAVVVGAIVIGGSRDDEKLVRSALTSYQDASSAKDYQRLCDDLLADSYVRRTAASGLPCEVALRTALEDVRNPKLEVLSVSVDGDDATAQVRGSAAGQVPGVAEYTLVREDDAWRILPPGGDSAAPTTP